MVGPEGLQADGQDAALIDVEVLDAKGQRCPTDDDKVDFTIAGPGIWRGGYNSGKIDSTNNLYLNTECGINRVSVRSTLSAGTITVTASRPGLKSASSQDCRQAGQDSRRFGDHHAAAFARAGGEIRVPFSDKKPADR